MIPAPYLAWLSSHARVLLSAGVFVGIAIPPLATLLQPLIVPAVIGTLTAALLRLDWQQISSQARRPWLPITLSIIQLIVWPLLIWLSVWLLGIPAVLGLIVILQAAAPPIGSAPVFVMLVGMEAALSVLVTVFSTLLLPLTLTPLIAWLPHPTLDVDLLTFFLRVCGFVITPFALARLLRQLCGAERLARNDQLLEAINVLLLVIFAIGVMHGVTARFFSDPGFIATLLLLAIIMAALLHCLPYWLYSSYDTNVAVTAAICQGNRNMGFMLAITAGTAGPEFSLYVGVAQIPMYFMPLLVSAYLQFRNIQPPRR